MNNKQRTKLRNALTEAKAKVESAEDAINKAHYAGCVKTLEWVLLEV